MLYVYLKNICNFNLFSEVKKYYFKIETSNSFDGVKLKKVDLKDNFDLFYFSNNFYYNMNCINFIQ